MNRKKLKAIKMIWKSFPLNRNDQIDQYIVDHPVPHNPIPFKRLRREAIHQLGIHSACELSQYRASLCDQ